MSVDREQIRRDAEEIAELRSNGLSIGTNDAEWLAHHCLALLTELKQAKRTIDRLRTEIQIVHEANERFEARLAADDKRDIRAELEQAQQKASFNDRTWDAMVRRLEAAEARLAKVPALVEAHKRIVALPVPRAVEAIEISDAALAAWEQE